MNRRRLRRARRRKDNRALLVRAMIASVVALAFVKSGAVGLPFSSSEIKMTPTIVYAEPMLHPAIVKAVKPLQVRWKWITRPIELAPAGEAIEVSLTQYCLRGETRRGYQVRPGIVAADPRVFPLARHVEVFLGERYLGRYIVDDTGKYVKGNTLDIWTPDCRLARRFGRQWGKAVLVPKSAPTGSERAAVSN